MRQSVAERIREKVSVKVAEGGGMLRSRQVIALIEVVAGEIERLEDRILQVRQGKAR